MVTVRIGSGRRLRDIVTSRSIYSTFVGGVLVGSVVCLIIGIVIGFSIVWYP